MPAFTLLKSAHGERMTKKIRKDGSVSPYEHAKWFFHSRIEFPDLDTFLEVMREVASSADTCMVAGAVKADCAGDEKVQRTKLAKAGQVAFFEADGAYRFLVLDMDYIDPKLIEGLDLIRDHRTVAERVRANFSTYLRRAKCVVQLSSGYGQKAKMRFYFIAERDLNIGHLPGNLSGGQKQRVAIARALISNPDIIFADEPTAALDKVSGLAAVQLFKDLGRIRGTTTVMVTHDPRILELADRVVTLEDGRIVRDHRGGGGRADPTAAAG